MNTAAISNPSPGTAVSGRVLVVDDHARARESMTDILRHLGHDVDVCTSAVEALAEVEHEAYDVIVTDLKMPGGKARFQAGPVTSPNSRQLLHL